MCLTKMHFRALVEATYCALKDHGSSYHNYMVRTFHLGLSFCQSLSLTNSKYNS